MSNGTRGPWRISAVVAALSLVLPFFVLLMESPVSAQVLLPACCRRGGQHHCMMRMMEGGADVTAPSSSPRFARLFEKCPYTPGVIQSASNALVWRPTPRLASALMQSGGAVALWDRSAGEVLQDSANFKRGPPLFHISA